MYDLLGEQLLEIRIKNDGRVWIDSKEGTIVRKDRGGKITLILELEDGSRQYKIIKNNSIKNTEE